MNRRLRTTATNVAIVCTMTVGLVRAARHDAPAPGALAAGLQAADEDPTPVIRLAALVGIQPGATATVTAPGRYAPGATVRMAKGPFTLADPSVTATAVKATVSAQAGSLPAVGELEVVAARGGARARAQAVYVAGRWTFGLQATNGWRIDAASDIVTAETATANLPFSVRFFKAGEAAPFETRKGELYVQSGSATGVQIHVLENQPGTSPECDRVTARYQQIAANMAKGGYDPKVMTELQKVQEKFTACMQAQQKAVTAEVQKQQDPGYQAAQQKKKDDFGCEYLNVTAEPGGSVKGYADCGKNVGRLELTGTVTHAEK